jgi:hypothetical protein
MFLLRATAPILEPCAYGRSDLRKCLFCFDEIGSAHWGAVYPLHPFGKPSSSSPRACFLRDIDYQAHQKGGIAHMSEKMLEQEEGGFTFTDKDFERRYYSSETTIPGAPRSGGSSLPVSQQATPSAGKVGSRNKFMRTLLRRRLASSG